MKAGWQEVQLGQLFEITSSKRVMQSDWRESGVPFFRAREIVRLASDGKVENELFISEDQFETFKNKFGAPEAGDIMVTGVGTLGRCYVVRPGDRFYFKDASVLWFRSRNAVNPRFIEYAFQTPIVIEQINAGVGATVGTFTISRAVQTCIPLPPLDEQKRIVAVLDEAFEGLSSARANAEANLADARELFGSTLSHMFIGNSDWPMGRIGDVGKVYDGPHATPRTVDSGPLFLGISSLVDGRIELEKTRHVTEEDFKTWTRRVLPQSGDVVFSYETRLGQVAIIPDGMQCCLGRRMGLIRLDRSRMLPDFFVLFYLSDYFQNYLRERTIKGATVDRLSIKDFPSFPFPLPTLEKQYEIVDRAERMRLQIDSLLWGLQEAVAEFDALRQSLLQKAFSGELTR